MAVVQAVSNDQFREDFPEFKDTTKFGESVLTFWLTIATVMVNACVWDPDLLNLGIELFAAHNIVIEAESLATIVVGGIPGKSTGAISSKSVGGQSISYDTASTLEEDAGHWGLTVYGNRFLRITRLMGAAPMVVAPPGCWDNAFSASSAWSGPPSGVFVGWDPNDPGG